MVSLFVAALLEVTLEAAETKTHREIHSLWGVFATTHRIVLLHLILFFSGVCALNADTIRQKAPGIVILRRRQCSGNELEGFQHVPRAFSGAVAGDAEPLDGQQPLLGISGGVRFAAVALVVPVHALLWACARWQVTGRTHCSHLSGYNIIQLHVRITSHIIDITRVGM